MAISWGAWEGSGNRMRVGIDTTKSAGDGGSVDHTTATCKIVVEYFTQNDQSWSDSQSLNLGGSIDGSIGYTNSQGDGVVTKRGEREYKYSYDSNDYGSSPGDRTFSATVNGAFNGITPSKSVTVAILARPYDNPASPTSVAFTRVSDETNKVSWVNHPTAGEPYGTITIERYIYAYGSYIGQTTWPTVATCSATTTSWLDSGAIPNRKWNYRVTANNGEGSSGSPSTGAYFTAPATPTACARSVTGVNDQKIDWTNNVLYSEHSTEVWHAANGVWDSTPLFTVGSGVETYTHNASSPGGAPSVGVKHKYKVRCKTTSGTQLYSSYSGETTETAGTTAAPAAPTLLKPTGIVVDPADLLVLTWKHNPSDGSAQTKFQVQHREVGAGSWNTTAEITSTLSTYSLDINSYGHGKSIEWQVKTWGTDAAASPFSASATITTNPAVALKYPVVLDLTTGRLEADSTGSLGGGGGTSFVGAALSNGSGQSIPTAVATEVVLPTVDFNTGMTIAGNGIQVIEAGVYNVTTNAIIPFNATGRRLWQLMVNGVQVTQTEVAATTSFVSTPIAITLNLAAGDIVTFRVYQNSGGSLTINTTNIPARLAVVKQGGAKGDPGVPGADGVVQVSPQHMRRYASAAQTIAHNSVTEALYDTQVESVGGITYSAGIWTVSQAGRYVITMGLGWTPNATGRRTAVIYKGDGTTWVAVATNDIPGNASNHTSNVAVTTELAAGEKVRISVYQSSGASLASTGASDRGFASITLAGGAKGDTGATGPGAGSLVSASIINTATQSIPSTPTTQVTLPTTLFNHGMTITGNTIIVPEASTYTIVGSAYFDSGQTAGRRMTQIYVNGVEVCRSEGGMPLAGNYYAIPVVVSLDLAAGDIVSFNAYQSSGVALNLRGDSSTTRLSVTKQGGAKGDTGAAGAPGSLTGPAGGDLGGTYPNPTIVKDAAAGTASMRTLGTGATQAAPGDTTNTRLSTVESTRMRVQDEGTSVGYPVARMNFVGAGVTAVNAGVPDTDLVTVTIPGGGAPSGAAGGGLAGTYPNPTIAARLDQIPAPTAAVALNTQKLTGVGNPTAAQDAVTKFYTDARTPPIVVLTQAAYDALGTKDSSTIYMIT